MNTRKILFAFVLFWVLQPSFAKITLPSIFSDHMVLQRNEIVLLWGWGSVNEEITVTTSWDGQNYTVATSITSKWEVSVPTPDAGGPYTLTFKSGDNEIQLKNILIGEVWLCAGQSNMAWSATTGPGIDNAEKEISNADYPNIRLFTVEKRTSKYPQEDLPGTWQVCTPETMKDFSAIAYFFARRIQGELNIPIGLIDNAWGGSPAEVWAEASVFENNPELAADAEALDEKNWGRIGPSGIYNAMVHALTPFKIAGTIWYQGESNVSRHSAYTDLFSDMVASWRKAWGYEFPFYYVQIAPFAYANPEEGAYLRDAQRRALDVIPKSGMVVISDIATIDDIHPPNKQDVGLRLANMALREYYDVFENEVYGPLFKELKIDANKVEVIFDHANNLVFKDKKMDYFEISGADGIFYPAKSKITNEGVVLTSKEVKNPEKVRFAWSNTAEPNLFNGAGLPASAFISDLKN